jgi:hypothetical protein
MMIIYQPDIEPFRDEPTISGAPSVLGSHIP